MYLKRVLTILLVILITLSCLREHPQKESSKLFCTQHIDSLLQSAQNNIFEGDLVSAIKCANKAYLIAIEQKDREREAEAGLSLSVSLFYLGSFKHSLDYIEKVLINPSTTPLQRVDAGRIKRRIYFKLELEGYDEKSFSELFKILRTYEDKDKANQRRAMLYNDISQIYLSKGDILKSIKILNSSRAILEKESSQFANYLFTSTGSYLASLYSSKGEFKAAEQILEEAYSRIADCQYPYLFKLLVVEGDLEYKRRNLPEAIELYKKASSNLKQLHIKDQLPDLYRKISLLYKILGENVDSARHYSRLAEIANSELVSRKYRVLKEINCALNRESSLRRSPLLIFILSTPFIILSLLLLGAAVGLLILKNRKKSLNIALKRREQSESMFKMLHEGKVDRTFSHTFELLYPKFTKRLLEEHPTLTESETTLCKLIFLELSSKEIASILFLEHRTVQTKKGRLRKSLQLPAGENLEQYFLKFK
ncbi:MAG: hypothetical protein WC960_00860 [Bacteroidales bacterium]